METSLAMRTACGLAVFFILLGSGRDALAAARFIQYLYVEANEGDSSGGHAAIRFEKQTFHFLHESSGIIRIRSLDSAAFNHAYAMLGNRAINESTIAVSEETYLLLRDGFAQLSLIQDAQLDILDNLRQDAALFEFLLKQLHDRNSGIEKPALPLKGVGYFLPDVPLRPGIKAGSGLSAAAVPPPPASLINLRNRIKATYGENFIDQRITQARAALRDMKLRAATPPVSGISRDIYPSLSATASTSYDDALLALFALELLQSAPNLESGSFWTGESGLFKLDQQESRLLSSFSGQLESELTKLVNSSRSDWGFPFIAGMARLASIEASLSSGYLVLLNLFQDDGRAKTSRPFKGERYLPAMKSGLQQVFLQRRKEFFESREMRESDYAALELAGNRLIDLEQSIASNSAPQQYLEISFPSRQAWRSDLVLPGMNEAALKQELEIARAAEREYAATLSGLYSYDLILRNCVTEIFTSINSIFERLAAAGEQAGQTMAKDSAQLTREESLKRLGGFVDASRGLAFIPFVSAKKVQASYSVVARHERPSYRKKQLAEMKKREAPLLVFLRESNTITSAIYGRAPEDSTFIFFTDDTILLRPLFGAFNLVAGLGESLLGLAEWPLKGPKRLRLGAKGMLSSLPELIFVNIRKGSMEYVEESKQTLSGS